MKMFQEFVKKLSIEISKDLPGFSAQKLMAPLGRRSTLDYLQENVVPRNSAVLILLYPGSASGRAQTVFILRSENEGGSHAGQIAFPGGGVDPSDKDFSETALREAEEEIGIDRRSVSLLGELTPLYIPVSNYMVHPFVGMVDKMPKFTLHPLEVQGLLHVDVLDLSDSNKSSVERFIKIKGVPMQVPCYDIQGSIIWGATAMIIAELSEVIGRIK